MGASAGSSTWTPPRRSPRRPWADPEPPPELVTRGGNRREHAAQVYRGDPCRIVQRGLAHLHEDADGFSASSISITGMSSRTGYRRPHLVQTMYSGSV